MSRRDRQPPGTRRTPGTHSRADTRDSTRIIVAGPNAVEAALCASKGSAIGAVHRVYLEDPAGPRPRGLAQVARGKGIPVSSMGKGECDRLAEARCQGIAAEVAYAYAELETLLARDGLLIFLDGIADPHNLGAVLRTAEAAGALGAVLPERRSAQVSATVMRVSAGAAVYLPVARVNNVVRSMQAAKEAGFWILGLDCEGERLLPRGGCGEDPRLGAKIGLVLGGEGEGMHRLVAEHCDDIFRLPMQGRVESLNASVAAAVAIYRLLDGDLYARRGG